MTNFRTSLLCGLVFSMLVLGQPVWAQDKDDPEREGGVTGTGIVGTITRLGSIVVNGLRVTFADDMSLENPVAIALAQDLRPGHTVAAQVVPDGDDWQALSIAQVLPVVGPVSDVDQAGFWVLGTRVFADQGTAVSQGDWVAVSGLWQLDTIVASRVDRIEPQPFASVTGTYFGPEDASRPLRIGTTLVDGIRPENARDGDVIRVRGQPGDGRLTAESIDLGLFDTRVGLVMAQGYMSAPSRAGHYAILGTGMAAFTETPNLIDTEILDTYCGIDGQILKSFEGPDQGVAQIFARLGCQR